ncbi:MAG: hypothetical protein HPY62_06875 [Bacteroidales bacterium]|nr:hypothetical protein [Bacteroidales bacterium]
MNNTEESNSIFRFERIFVAVLALASALILIYLAVQGPLFLNNIRYKTAEVINNQLIAQDIVNMFLLSPVLIAGAISLIFRKPAAGYLLIITPLYLIYYALSYTIGWEWSSSQYSGNNEQYTFWFLFILISSLIILLYSLTLLPSDTKAEFSRKGLVIYTFFLLLLLLIFASMWIKEILEVISTGTTRGYDIAPTAFWLVRTFDLGFTVPLGIISVYLLWTRPGSSFRIQFLFYGFFMTMIIAVNAMGFIMLIKKDPTFMMRDLIVFLVLAIIIFSGFLFIFRSYRIRDKQLMK